MGWFIRLRLPEIKLGNRSQISGSFTVQDAQVCHHPENRPTRRSRQDRTGSAGRSDAGSESPDFRLLGIRDLVYRDFLPDARVLQHSRVDCQYRTLSSTSCLPLAYSRVWRFAHGSRYCGPGADDRDGGGYQRYHLRTYQGRTTRGKGYIPAINEGYRPIPATGPGRPR